MRKIGFLGHGKIAKSIIHKIKEEKLGELIFAQDKYCGSDGEEGYALITTWDKDLYEEVDLIIECATAMALEEHIEAILQAGDLMVFSVTAFSSSSFSEKAQRLAAKYNRHIYIPHGAILGLDGIRDGRSHWNEISIVTTKSPSSLGRQDTSRAVVFEGTTREACKQYPRNVNVHAAIALMGIGFDQTKSKIISDPSVTTNAHHIEIKGQGIHIQMDVSSYTEGGVSGMYTFLSASNSVRHLLDTKEIYKIV